MLFSNFDFSNFDVNTIMIKLFSIISITIAMTFHEFGHALAAVKMGDKLPETQGRLTLNPRAHIDILGFIMLILTNFGWGKPVITDPRNYKNKKVGNIVVSMGGIFFNLVLALISALIIRILGTSSVINLLKPLGENFIMVAEVFFLVLIQMNVILILFNIIPIPPLDGSVFVSTFLKGKQLYKFEQFGQWGMFVLIFLIFTGLISYVLSKPLSVIMMFMYKIAGLSFM